MAIYVLVKRTDFRLCMLATIILIPVAIIFVYINFHQESDTTTSGPDSPANSTGSRAASTLQLLIVASRHGNRPPLGSFPTWIYPENDTAVWPYGADPLTKLGRVKTYRLGAKLRSLYNGFLDQLYYSKDFLIYSTITERTLQSAEQIVTGLFPPVGYQVWKQGLMWQPIPIYPTYIEGTHLWDDAQTTCPKYVKAMGQSVAQFDKDYATHISSIMTYLQNYTGIPAVPGSHAGLYSIWDCFVCAENQGLPLPDWTTQVYPEPLTGVIAKLFAAYTISSDEMIRLFQGRIFQQVMGLMEAKIKGIASPDRKMVHYSGHDTTLLGLQAILGLPRVNDTIVKTGSALIFELHKSVQSSISYIEVLYIDGNSTDMEPTVLEIPGCPAPCDFQSLQSITEKYYNITDYSQECFAN